MYFPKLTRSEKILRPQTHTDISTLFIVMHQRQIDNTITVWIQRVSQLTGYSAYLHILGSQW